MWKVTSLSNALIAKTLEAVLIRACGAQRLKRQEGVSE